MRLKMRSVWLVMPVMFFIAVLSSWTWAEGKLLDFTLPSLSPKGEINLAKAYSGKVILVVNTASACGFTPQFSGLEKLYQKYKDHGFVVLGFPSNDFNQEPKAGEEIIEFCRLKYDVSFPMFKRSSVKGETANPFYQKLISASEGKYPTWNFFKYLVDQNQSVVGVFPSQAKAIGGDIESQITALLNIPASK